MGLGQEASEHMETARCRAFLTAAESGSFSAAAELLGYTPSGVSQLVSALENELGVSLLSRSKRGVALTPSGESLLPAAREMLRQEQRLREQAAELKGLAMGSVTIATYASIARRWLPEVIRAFRADYPQIRIDVVEGIWQELHQMVGERRADMAFMSYAEPMPYDFVELTKDPMLAILPRDHPLAGAERYPLERCREETFIMPAKGRDVDIVEMLKRAGIELQIKVSTLENLSALAMIEQGLGMSVMNDIITQRWECDVVKLPLDPPQEVTLGVAVPDLAHLAPAAKRFLDYAVARLKK